MRVELMLMIAGDRWHDYMQVEYSAHAPKCVCAEVEMSVRNMWPSSLCMGFDI